MSSFIIYSMLFYGYASTKGYLYFELLIVFLLKDVHLIYAYIDMETFRRIMKQLSTVVLSGKE